MVGDEREVLAAEALARQLEVARRAGQRLGGVEAVVDAPPRAVERRRPPQVALAQRPVQAARVAAAALDVDAACPSSDGRGLGQDLRQPGGALDPARRARVRPPGALEEDERLEPVRVHAGGLRGALDRPAVAQHALRGDRHAARRARVEEVRRARRSPAARGRPSALASTRTGPRPPRRARRPAASGSSARSRRRSAVAAAARSPRRRRRRRRPARRGGGAPYLGWQGMKWESVLAWRVQRQHLARRATDALAVTSDLCGLHAQVHVVAPSSRCGRGWRTRRTSRICCGSRRALVKTWSQRGTLHLLRTDELPLYVGAQSGLKPRYEQKSWLKAFKLTAEGRPDDPRRASRRRCEDGPLTREELARAGPPGPRPRLRRPAQAGRVPRRADLHVQDHSLRAPGAVRAAGRRGGDAGDRPPLPDPLRARPRREELAKWFGSPSPARPGAGSRRSATRRSRPSSAGRSPRDVDGIEAAEPSGVVNLLPAFDQYVVAAPRDTRATSAPERIYRPGGWFSPVLLVDGVMAGVWSLEDGHAHDRAVRHARRRGPRGRRGRGRTL